MGRKTDATVPADRVIREVAERCLASLGLTLDLLSPNAEDFPMEAIPRCAQWGLLGMIPSGSGPLRSVESELLG